MDWKQVLPSETLGEEYSGTKFQHEDVDDEYEDHLYISLGSDVEEDVAKHPTYKSGEGRAFKLGMMFINKEKIRDVVKEYGMDNQKNVWIKKNDAKRVVVRCIGGCKFYLRISKRNGQQYQQVVSYECEHTYYRNVYNRNSKKKREIGQLMSQRITMCYQGSFQLSFVRNVVKFDTIRGRVREKEQLIRKYQMEVTRLRKEILPSNQIVQRRHTKISRRQRKIKLKLVRVLKHPK